jgi:plastocyanin
MKNWVFALLILSLFATRAAAGDIKGKVGGKPGSAVVIWVEGVKKFQVPRNRPSISQSGTRFTPTVLVVVAGQTVDMPNDDNVAHNVFSYSPTKQFNLGIYPKGDMRSVTFPRTGVVDLFCSIHRHMNAKIVVVPNPFFSQTTGGSSYRIESVPPGKYVVKMWGPAMGVVSKEVIIPARGDVYLDF